jgi:tRNA threonylcarbamoyladenosine biosynthesis protein TsaE
VSVAVPLVVPDATHMRGLGARLAGLLHAGDLLLLNGPLGAGKTTLTQGIAAGLGVAGPVTSPTFVLAREHEGAPGRPGLVHVDAYRLRGWDELDDLDLDASMGRSVTVVEWGAGVAEPLGADRLEVVLEPQPDGSRHVRWRAHGDRWAQRAASLAGLSRAEGRSGG